MKTDRTDAQQKRKFLGVCLIGAALILIGAMLVLLSRDADQKEENSTQTVYGQVLSEFYDAVLSQDGQAMCSLTAPSAYWTYIQETYSETEEQEIEAQAETAASYLEYWQGLYGTNLQVSFSIGSLEQQSEEAISELNEELEETGCTVSQAVVLTVSRTISGSSGSIQETIQPTLIQVDGQWYLIDPAMDSTTQSQSTTSAN